MIYLLLVYEFFKIGLFSLGGGYATLPFLYNISETYNWYSIKELSYMTGIASITPGPVGINVATFAGLKTAGLIGSILATTSEILPSFILVIIVSKILKKFSDNFYVKSIIETLKPISCALLLSVGINLFKQEMTDIYSIILLLVLFIISFKSKKDPIIYMAIAGIIGIIKTVLI